MFIPDSYNHGISTPIRWKRYYCQNCKHFYNFDEVPMRVYVKSLKPRKAIYVCDNCMKKLMKGEKNGINKSNK